MIGKLICDRYQVIQILGQGMFCQTYTVRDITLIDFPTCVVKHFLPSDRVALPVKTRRRLFNREVGALAKLDGYEYVPHLLNHFECDREFYLVQEYIDGHPLSKELESGKNWCQTRVIQLLQEVLGILIFVHSQGLIHRDIKPSNIMRRSRDNRLILIDFGAVKPIWNELVKDRENADKYTNCDGTTIAIGTPGYMPYEQHQGKPVPSSDIYALGMIGIQALTGIHPTKLPEDRNTGQILWQHLAEVDSNLAIAIDKMVSYHCQNRYKSATQALAALKQLTDLHPRILSNKALPSANALNSSIAPSTKKAQQVVTAEKLESQSNELTTSSTLLSPNNLNLEKQNKEMSPATQSETIISIFPDKSALFIGLVIGVVSGLALMIFSYLSMQTIYPIPKLQNTQMQTPPRSR